MINHVRNDIMLRYAPASVALVNYLSKFFW